VPVPYAPDLSGCALDDRYELHAVIGEGAFGRVYRGVDRRLTRPVAVKVIKPWWAEDSGWVERFEREARLLARVNDAGIVQIFDVGRAEEGPYYVAELIDGESLAERLRGGPLPVAEARSVAEQLCQALAGAHVQGVVHCDVKPANVLLAADGRVKIGDFGVARLAESTSQAASATVAGTPRYMSPEQARGRRTTPATDVYSAGVVLYEMLAGEPPFMHGSAVELGLRHLSDPPPPLPSRVPVALCRVVETALAKDPADRYPDGAAMAGALRGADAAPAATAEPTAIKEPRPAATATARAATDTAEAVEQRTIAEGMASPLQTRTIATRVLSRRGSAAPPASPRASGPRGKGPERRRRGAALAAGALGLLVLALGIFLLAGGRARTTVPELRGLPRGGVQARAERQHVHPAFLARYAYAVAGTAIAQNPSAGTRIAEGSTVRVVLSAGPPPARVPGVVGQSSSSAENALVGAGLHYHVKLVPAPGASPDVVLQQAPGAAATVAHDSTVTLNVAEAPRWRALTTFSGVDDGHSVPFRILGSRWRVSYSMAYNGICLLLLVCMGPSAEAQNLETDSSFGGFELGEGPSETHTYESGPGLYQLNISGGHDSARWSMTVEDYY
jgi:eukaryotic-like serine/threonine-protein kinase